jgi:hypothetical protein
MNATESMLACELKTALEAKGVTIDQQGSVQWDSQARNWIIQEWYISNGSIADLFSSFQDVLRRCL